MTVMMLEKAKGTKVGGKAASLGELLRLNVNVPPGFVVDADEFDRHLDAEAISIQQLLDFMRLSGLLEQVAKAYEMIGKGKVAVRSSAVGEDGQSLSFAGQHDTYLNVEGLPELITAILKCWASTVNERALEYRKSNNVEKVSMAVIVQKMVQSEVSGVMFTIDPTNVADGSGMVIEAVWGLGETIVSGEITPDRYMVHKSGKLTEMRVVAQEWELRDGTHQPVDEARQVSPKLTKQQVLHLAETGLLLEREYGWPQDIEWAIDGSDTPYIVQSRPITTLSKGRRDKIEVSGEMLAKGIGASGGVATGVGQSYESTFKKGGVLIVETTNPDFLPVMKKAVAVVTGKGGMTCHAAIVCRELGIPCVVGVGSISHLIGMGLTVNGDAGVVVGGGDVSPVPVEKVKKESKPTPKITWVSAIKPKVEPTLVNVVEVLEKAVGPGEVIEPTQISEPKSENLKNGFYADKNTNTLWIVYEGKGYPFNLPYSKQHDKVFGELIAGTVTYSSSSFNSSDLVPIKKLSAKDFELEQLSTPKKPSYVDKGDLGMGYVTLKVTKWPEGTAEVKAMGGKYNPSTKTWKVPANAEGLKKLKYLKAAG